MKRFRRPAASENRPEKIFMNETTLSENPSSRPTMNAFAPEDLNQEERENRKDHFAADVGEERHDTEDDHVHGESVREGSAGGHRVPAEGRRKPRPPTR